MESYRTTNELNLQRMSCMIAQGSIYSCKARMSQVLCTCHQLSLGVGPRANKGNMLGEHKGKLVSLPLERGKFTIHITHKHVDK